MKQDGYPEASRRAAALSVFTAQLPLFGCSLLVFLIKAETETVQALKALNGVCHKAGMLWSSAACVTNKNN